MKAWTLATQAPIEARPLALTEIPDPHAGKNQIRMKVSYSGICRTDIHIAEGDLPLKKGTMEKISQTTQELLIQRDYQPTMWMIFVRMEKGTYGLLLPEG